MVKLHVKREEKSQFLYETSAVTPIRDLTEILATIYNGRLKIERICKEIEVLSKHGIAMLPSVQDEHIRDDITGSKRDESSSKCVPLSDDISSKDPNVRRDGKALDDKMAKALSKVATEAMYAISKDGISADVCLTRIKISEILDMLRDAVSVAFPMGLPPYDPIQQEFENNENLSHQQQSNVICLSDVCLWWAGKLLQLDKVLSDYIGKNEKTKIIVQIQKNNQGPPSREPLMGQEEQSKLMLHAYRRQEELKLIQDEDDSYLDAQWADRQTLKKSFHGVDAISWKPH